MDLIDDADDMADEYWRFRSALSLVLASSQSTSRRTAARGSTRLYNPRGTDALLTVLSDSDGRVRAEAKQALRQKLRPSN